MSKNSLILVLQNKQENSTIDMAKIYIKSEKLTPFGGLFLIMEQFDSTLSSVIDSTSVPAKWIRTSRRYVLNIYTCNNAYADVFQTDFG